MKHNSIRISIRISLIAATLLFCVPLAAQVGRTSSTGGRPALSLQDLEQTALQGSSALRAERFRYEAARAQLPQAAALPDAKIGFGYFAVPVETRLGPQQASLSVSQSFPWFGTLAAEESAADARARQQFTRFADARNRVIVDVRDIWYRLYLLERTVALTRDHLALVSTLREVAFARYEAGTLPFSHLLRLDMELEELRTRLQNFGDDWAPLLGSMSRLTDEDLSAEMLALPDSLAMPGALADIDALQRAMEADNPQLEGLMEEGKYWRERSTAARRMGYPSFTLGVTYTAIGPREDVDVADNGRDAIIPQVGLSFPLFGSRYSAMEEQAQLQVRAAEAAHEDLRQRLSTVMQKRISDLRDARRRFALARRLGELSRQTWQVLLEEYRTGKAGIEELLAVERDLLRLALDSEQARADANRAADELRYLTAQDKE